MTIFFVHNGRNGSDEEQWKLQQDLEDQVQYEREALAGL